MFSHDDIYTLLTLQSSYTQPNPVGNDLFVCMLTVWQSDGMHTYAIKIENMESLQNLIALHNNQGGKWDKLGDDLEADYSKYANGTEGGSPSYINVFLKFIKGRNLGVSLYEQVVTGQGTSQVANNWNKLELNSQEQNISLPCN